MVAMNKFKLFVLSMKNLNLFMAIVYMYRRYSSWVMNFALQKIHRNK